MPKHHIFQVVVAFKDGRTYSPRITASNTRGLLYQLYTQHKEKLQGQIIRISIDEPIPKTADTRRKKLNQIEANKARREYQLNKKIFDNITYYENLKKDPTDKE